MPRRIIFLLLVLRLAAAFQMALAAADKSVSLAGAWRFELDRLDVGVSERWFQRTLPDKVKLPGDLTAQGIGDPVTVDTKWIGGIVDKSWFTAPEFAAYRQPGNVKVPFWLQPELYYAGAAWFQREIRIPNDWQGRRVVLFLERPHWETRVWVDGKCFGTNNAIATPHEYDLGQLAPGDYTLSIRVDNRMIIDLGENSHSVSDHTQGNWNGIVGRIELRSTPLVWMEDVQVYPEAANARLRAVVKLGNASGGPGEGKLRVLYHPGANSRNRRISGWPQRLSEIPVRWTAAGADLNLEFSLPREQTNHWDEFSADLHQLSFELSTGDVRLVRLGLRELATEGTQFIINGRRLFFRGTLDCAIFPKTGHPPTEVAEWQRLIKVAKAHGLNLLRFHSWCPPEAAFIAADELGFYLHVECSSWPNQSTTLGDGKPVDNWIYAEADRILKAYGNHPSFMLLLAGNEPGGNRHQEFLARWVEHFKSRDPRRLVSGGASWPQLAEDQFHLTPDPRVQGWGEGLKSRLNAQPPASMTDYRDYVGKRNVPVISHEIGQWCVYPNFAEMKKYTGYLKPRNFEIFRDRLAAAGMAKLAKPFLLASGKLQALCYKEDIESALRTPGMGGFQLLELHDFPGQGTALVGVLDPFWEEKGYISPAEFRRFCNPTVPLARLPKRVFTTDERLTAAIELAHFGSAPIANAVVEWRLVVGNGTTCARGEFPGKLIPVDNAIALGNVSVDLKNLPAPAQGKLIVKLRGTEFENDWDLWVYPAPPAVAAAADVLVTSQFDEVAQARLRTGGRVLLTIPGEQVRNFDTAPIKLGFSSIFWNTAWTGRQAPTTLGVLCDPKHPALATFPTEFHSNWQWWYLIHRAGALRLDLLPEATKPIVRVIDDWVTARPLGLVVEGRVGRGRIVICGFDLTRDADDPVSRQMRSSLIRYLGSKARPPAVEFTPQQIQSLIVERGG